MVGAGVSVGSGVVVGKAGSVAAAVSVSAGGCAVGRVATTAKSNITAAMNASAGPREPLSIRQTLLKTQRVFCVTAKHPPETKITMNRNWLPVKPRLVQTAGWIISWKTAFSRNSAARMIVI